jgi:hypothetical protein
VNATASARPAVVARRFGWASSPVVVLPGSLLLLLAVSALTLSYLAHSLRAAQVVVVPLFVAAAALGLVVLRRQPRNAVGWVWIGVVLVAIVDGNAQQYALLREPLRESCRLHALRGWSHVKHIEEVFAGGS